ncbi:FK506-binding nuclear protein [Rhodotorula toruloides]|nr:FK506-binding nuclear protein [Rhodotorula toruloides]
MAQPLILGLWSIVLEPGKTYSQNTSPAIQITNVSYGAEVKGNARSAVTMKYPEFEQDSDDEEDEEEEEDDEEIKLPKIITKEPVLAVLRPNAIEQASINVTLVEDVEVVEFSVTGENPVHLVGHYVRQEDFDQPPSDYDSEEEYGSDFDDEDDSDSEGMSGLIDDDEDDEDMEDAADRIQEIEEPKKAASKKRPAEETPAGADDSTVSAASVAGLSKNQKKKLAKKQKAENGEAVAPAAEEKKAVEPKKAEAKKEEPKKETRKTQVLAGGLEITDFKEGTGPAAKAGSKVGMRYIGKLDNGKVFDSNTKGAPLVFTLGRGQVIKGWDLGVAGMRVGGERKLVIPPALAYGKQKLPGLPPNSRLTFDVKLISAK